MTYTDVTQLRALMNSPTVPPSSLPKPNIGIEKEKRRVMEEGFEKKKLRFAVVMGMEEGRPREVRPEG